MDRRALLPLADNRRVNAPFPRRRARPPARYSAPIGAAERAEFIPFVHRLIGIAFAVIQPLFLRGVHAYTEQQLDLFDHNWPIWTYAEITPPAKFVHDEQGRRGTAVSSLVAGGCIVSGASIRGSLIGTGSHVHSYAYVENSVVLPQVDVGRGARLRNVVIDKGTIIPAKLVVGEDPELDAERFRRTENGICLITQHMIDRL